ncbi:MAG: Abi family protein [Propionibacteriaceae bacterium]|nr:Abi family protein [Propionibacteriaceae bacterium]
MTRLLADRSFSRLAEYWRHFETDPITHHFATGTTVAVIADVYDYDATLRRMLTDGLAIFEIALRSRLGYQISTAHNPYDYLDPASYIPQTVRRAGTVVALRDELVADLRRDLDRSKEDFIAPYRRRGDLPPLWSAMEVLSMGSVSKMYRLLVDQQIRRDITRGFGYPNPAFAESVFHSLTVLRNVCAHHARIWHRTSIQIAPRVLNRLKTDPDTSIYQSTPWAWLVVLADLVDTIRGDHVYSDRLWAHVDTRPQYIDGLTHPSVV